MVITNYLTAIEALEKKCMKSGFNKNLVLKMTKITKEWVDRFSPPKLTRKNHFPNLVWATGFPSLLKLTRKEKELNQEACVVYRRPPTIANKLTRYKEIAHLTNEPNQGISKPCCRTRCKLCGGAEGKGMVNTRKFIISEKGKEFPFVKPLSCIDWGIYAATCVICHKQYVGQTTTNFATRWSQHRLIWKKTDIENNDKAALRIHYNKLHAEIINPVFANAFQVCFMDKPKNPKDLDFLESRWMNKLLSDNNINPTILPKILQ